MAIEIEVAAMDTPTVGNKTYGGTPVQSPQVVSDTAHLDIQQNEVDIAAKVIFPFTFARDIKPCLKTIDFVEDFLTYGGMSIGYGESNGGKSFFFLDLAFHVSLGKEWHGKQVDQGTVVYIALEGTQGIDNRIVALKNHYKDDIRGNIPLVKITTPINLCESPADSKKLVETIKRIESEAGPVILVVVDTLSRAMAGGDENAPGDMTSYVRNVDRIRTDTGAHVMSIHHCGKNAAMGARGHSSLRAAAE